MPVNAARRRGRVVLEDPPEDGIEAAREAFVCASDGAKAARDWAAAAWALGQWSEMFDHLAQRAPETAMRKAQLVLLCFEDENPLHMLASIKSAKLRAAQRPQAGGAPAREKGASCAL